MNDRDWLQHHFYNFNYIQCSNTKIDFYFVLSFSLTVCAAHCRWVVLSDFVKVCWNLVRLAATLQNAFLLFSSSTVCFFFFFFFFLMVGFHINHFTTTTTKTNKQSKRNSCVAAPFVILTEKNQIIIIIIIILLHFCVRNSEMDGWGRGGNKRENKTIKFIYWFISNKKRIQTCVLANWNWKVISLSLSLSYSSSKFCFFFFFFF